MAALVAVSTLVVLLESGALAGALAYGLWARRSRDVSRRRGAGLEADLQGFLGGYAKLAKIPQPKPVAVPWGAFLDGLRGFWPQPAVLWRR